MKLRKEMIDPSYPLAHAVVVLIFRPERDLKKRPGKSAGKTPLPPQAAVASNLAESGVPVGDQAQAGGIVRENAALHDGRVRCAEGRPHQVVVEIRGPG